MKYINTSLVKKQYFINNFKYLYAVYTKNVISNIGYKLNFINDIKYRKIINTDPYFINLKALIMFFDEPLFHNT